MEISTMEFRIVGQVLMPTQKLSMKIFAWQLRQSWLIIKSPEMLDSRFELKIKMLGLFNFKKSWNWTVSEELSLGQRLAMKHIIVDPKEKEKQEAAAAAAAAALIAAAKVIRIVGFSLFMNLNKIQW